MVVQTVTSREKLCIYASNFEQEQQVLKQLEAGFADDFISQRPPLTRKFTVFFSVFRALEHWAMSTCPDELQSPITNSTSERFPSKLWWWALGYWLWFYWYRSVWGRCSRFVVEPKDFYQQDGSSCDFDENSKQISQTLTIEKQTLPKWGHPNASLAARSGVQRSGRLTCRRIFASWLMIDPPRGFSSA